MINSRYTSALAALALSLLSSSASAAPQELVSVCAVSAQATRYVGKRVRVEGYIVNLGSHGFVLVSKRSCKSQGQLVLQLKRVSGTTRWQSAFATSDGPKRAILIGVLRWKPARYDGAIPGLDVERIESLAAREADWSEF